MPVLLLHIKSEIKQTHIELKTLIYVIFLLQYHYWPWGTLAAISLTLP